MSAMPEREQPIVCRKEAKARGLSVYFTGKPCKHGHLSERNFLTRACADCLEKRNKEYYWANRDKSLAANSDWYEAHKADRSQYAKNRRLTIGDKLRAQSLDWNRRNPDKIRISARSYYDRNRLAIALRAKTRYALIGYKYAKERYLRNGPKLRAEWKAWYHAHRPENAARAQVYRARLTGAEGHHTGREVRHLMAKQRMKCASCKISIKSCFHEDHIKPLSLGGSNWIKNIQLLCPPCNLSKKDKDPIVWAQQNGRLL